MIVGGVPRKHFDVTLGDGRVVTMESVFIEYTFATSWHKGEGSALAVVWFQDSFDEPLLDRFAGAVHSLSSWKSVAIPWSD